MSGAKSDRGPAVYAVLRHARPIVLNSARVVEAQVRSVGWTVGTRAVAELLDAGGPATVPQLGERLDLPRQATQRYVDVLRRLGHAETTPNPRHRRSVLVALTETGRAAFRTVQRAELAQLADLAPECGTDELELARAVLAAIDRDISAKAHQAGGTT